MKEKEEHKVSNIQENDVMYETTIPSYYEQCDDYIMTDSNVNVWCYFDITCAAQQWTENANYNNYGIMLRTTSTTNNCYVKFCDSDYPGTTVDPAYIYSYRETSGLEEYWTYKSQSAGTAGTGHVNLFNGNLTVIAQDAQTIGERPTVNISHIYNSNRCLESSPFGRGWRLNVMQQLETETITELTGNNTYFVYTDSDGTRHYFYNDNGTLKDEDSLGLVLTEYNSGDLRYQIKTKDNDILRFDQYSYLRQHIFPDGNTITYSYVRSEGRSCLTEITDANSNVLQLEYAGNYDLLSSILDVSTQRRTYFYYSGDGLLTSVNRMSETSLYTYGGYLMAKMQEYTSGRGIIYNYTNTGTFYRVNGITETSSSGNGQILTLAYTERNTTVLGDCGADGNYITDYDNNYLTYQFNNFGQAVCITDEDGASTELEYYPEDNKQTQLHFSAGTQTYTENLLSDSGMNTAPDTNSAWETSGNEYIAVRDTSIGYENNSSIKLSKQTTSGNAILKQGMSLGAGTYTYSVYAKAQNVSGIVKLSAAQYTNAQCTELITETFSDEELTGTTDDNIDKGWYRLVVTFELDSSAYVVLRAGMYNSSGNVWFDCAQLETGNTATKVNLVENSMFRRCNGYAPIGWAEQSASYGSGCIENTYAVGSNVNFRSVLLQEIFLSGGSGEVFICSAYGKLLGRNNENAICDMVVAVIGTSGSVDWYSAKFNTGVMGWQYNSLVIPTKQNYFQISLYLVCENQPNNGRFTKFQLVKDDGETYSYDNNGNVTNIKSVASDSSFTYNGNSRLIAQTNISGNSFNYSYNMSGQLTSANNSASTGYSFTYDNYGNAVSSKTYSDKYISETETEKPYDEGTYRLRIKCSGYYLTVNNDNSLVQKPQNDSETQLFQLKELSDNEYLIYKSGTQQRVYVSYSYAYLFPVAGEIGNSVFVLINTGQGSYKIAPKYYQSYPIGVANNSTASGTPVTMNYDNGAEGNQFVLEKCHEIITSAVYSSNGSKLLSTTDTLGTEISYGYDANNRLKSSQTIGNRTTNYTYDTSDRLTAVSSVNSTVSYSYYMGLIHDIISPSGTQYDFIYDNFGNMVSTKIGNRTLITNNYVANNGMLSGSVYGNGTTVSYVYDKKYNIKEKKINNNTVAEYIYNTTGQITSLKDIICATEYKYHYDSIGRPISITADNGTANYWSYDNKNRTNIAVTKITDKTLHTELVYDSNGCVITIKNENTPLISYVYDALLRRHSKELNIGSGFTTEYKYQTAENGNTTALVSQLKNGNDTLSYTYDDIGNIETVSKNGVLKNTYHYDALNQLIREDNVDVNTVTYSYDNGGNITSKKEYAYIAPETEITNQSYTEKSYSYGDTSWKDLLAGFNNQTITYDNIGNPLTYRDGFGFTWSSGRQLTGVTKNTNSISYLYNADGLRAQKTVNNIVTDYYWLNGVLQGQKTGNEYIVFLYDENGSAYGFLIKNGATEAYHYYLFNAQGDVIGIVDNNGSLVVEYTYDSWGKLLSVTGTLASTIGQINPIRYRGYYFDSETGFYYLQSRYYDPETGRFINADGQIMTGSDILGCNLFAYCGNNPINNMDIDGHSWKSIKQWISNTYNKVKNQLTKAIGKVKKNSKKSAEKIASGVTLELGIGMGLKGELEIAGIDASVGVKSDSITAKISSKKSQIGQSNEAEIRVGLGPVEIGPSLEDWNPVSDSDEYVSEFSWYKRELTLDFGAEIYLLYGFSVNLSMDLNKIAEGLVIIFE